MTKSIEPSPNIKCIYTAAEKQSNNVSFTIYRIKKNLLYRTSFLEFSALTSQSLYAHVLTYTDVTIWYTHK